MKYSTRTHYMYITVAGVTEQCTLKTSYTRNVVPPIFTENALLPALCSDS